MSAGDTPRSDSTRVPERRSRGGAAPVAPVVCPWCGESGLKPGLVPDSWTCPSCRSGFAAQLKPPGQDAMATLVSGGGGDLAAAVDSSGTHRILAEELPVDDQHEMLGELGSGGMGTVVIAEHHGLRREVAMKILRESEDKRLRLRFIEEARITGQLEHPNIVPVHDLGIDEATGRLFFTMKRVRGQTLEDLLDEARDGHRVERVELPSLLRVLIGACNAAGFAHSRGVVHRDLKPANIMTGPFGEVLVMDWGLAKPGAVRDAEDGGEMASRVLKALEVDQLTGAVRQPDRVGMTLDGEVIGTIPYMPPEQADGRIDQIDERSDIYALGAILYEILCLEPPVTDGSPDQLLDRVIEGDIPDPRERAPPGREVPADLAAVAMKALAHDPEERYQTVRELRGDIQRHLEGRSVSAKEDSAWEMVVKLVRRNRQVSAAIAVALLLVIGTATVGYLINAEARREAEDHLARLQTEQQARQEAESARASSDTMREALLARIEAENRRTWQEIYATDFDDLEDWRVTTGWATILPLAAEELPSQLGIGPEGLVIHSDRNLGIALQRSYGGDLRASWRATFHGGQDGGMHVSLGGSDWESGYVFQVGGWNNSRSAILRGAERDFSPQVLQGVPFELEAGRTYRLQATVRRLDERVLLSLEVDGRVLLEAVDNDPLEARLGIGNGFALLANGPAHSVIHELRLEGLNAPMKVQLADLARRHMEQGNYATAADLYRDLRDASHDPERHRAAVQGLEVARMLSELEPHLPRLQAELAEAWGGAEVAFRLSSQGVAVSIQGGTGRDLTALAGLPVADLRIMDTPLADLSALRGMPLTTLLLRGIQVEDFTPLRGLPLERATIMTRAPVPLEVLRGMPLHVLNLGITDARDLSALDGMPLEAFSATAPELRSLDGLGELPLRDLRLRGARIEDLAPLAGMDLQRLTLIGAARLVDIAVCAGLTELRVLDLAGTGVRDLTPLRGLQLQSLRIDGTRVRNLTPLAGMRLDVLSLVDTEVTDLAPAVSPVLRYLDLGGTRVQDLTPLAVCSLLHLSVAQTPVRSLAPVAGQPLDVLDLSGSAVEDLAPVAGSSLRRLRLADCPIEDLSPLADQQVEELDLLGTPFTRLEQLDGLPLVRLRLPAGLDPDAIERLRARNPEIVILHVGREEDLRAPWSPLGVPGFTLE